MATRRPKNELSPSLPRNTSIFTAALVLLASIWIGGSAGLASILSRYAIAADQVNQATLAVKLSRNDPDVRLSRAALLEANGDQASAVSEYETAVRLRPDDYVLWLAVARAHEMAGDSTRATAAAREAVRFAPYYAETHWQLGNILVRAGKEGEGFKELSAAADSDPTLLPGIIDLAWHLLNSDAEAVERAIGPHTPETYRALARFFRQQNRTDEAIAMFKSAGSDAVGDVRSYVGELILQGKYSQAYSLWTMSHESGATISNGGFETESDLTEPGFGWRTADPPPLNCRFTLDATRPNEGKLSLRVDFNGDSDPVRPVISQLVLVQPSTRYELRFAARSMNLVSAGLPIIVIIDAETKSIIGKSEQFSRTSPDWRDYVVDFSAGASTKAIQVGLQREGCAAPCPIFGQVWLDEVSLRKL